MPPQPTVSVTDEQRILAERLVAKETLRRAFQSAGCSWHNSGTPVDTHGEMGLVADYDDRKLAVASWFLQEGKQVDAIARVVARGTRITAASLAQQALNLPVRVEQVVSKEPDPTRGLATALAEAGVLPMYGMPTAVRNLYFALPSKPAHGREPKSLDRTLDQAITEFAPGSERLWDKRQLEPIGLAGPIRHEYRDKWKSKGRPIGDATWQTFCPECRNLDVQFADPTTFRPTDDIPGWEESWVRSPQKRQCSHCKLANADLFLAVTPSGFITDFDIEKPIKSSESSRGGGPRSFVASPSLGAAHQTVVGRASIALSRQGKVYRVAQAPGGQPFGFSKAAFARTPRGFQELEGQLWKLDDDSPQIRASLSSPKTTDILSVRLTDGVGLEFFDSTRFLASRKAAWYSAATILQRAIALELDVDSLDIEIASVHKLSDDVNARGAELYLADEHPNGAGLVDWASRHWADLLQGCVEATGPFATLGRMIREECKRSSTTGQVWRSPDVLLRGFRNRQLHGLIDWRLGIELLHVMRDPSFVPGRDALVEAWSVGQESWDAHASQLAQTYCIAYERSSSSHLKGSLGVHGWMGCDGGMPDDCTLFVVSHPLWSQTVLDAHTIGPAIRQLAIANNASRIRLVDSFNLSHRMAWVRGNQQLFPVIDLGGAAPTPAVAAPDQWMQDVMALTVGDSITQHPWCWTRVRDHHYVMVLHEHQNNPHVHLSVKAESIEGKRLNPRKTDLHRWRETFAEKLRELGVEAEATRQASRGANRRDERIWQVKARQQGRLSQGDDLQVKSGADYERSRSGAFQAWAHIKKALQASDVPEDRELAKHIVRFVSESAYFKEVAPRLQREAAQTDQQRPAPVPSREVAKTRPSVDMER